jgi:WD40 repeat protein
MSSDEEAEFLGEEEDDDDDDDDDEMEVESETPEEEDSEEEESKSRRKSARNKGAPRKKSTKMTTRQLRQSYISALASVPSEAVIAATAAAAAVPTTTSPVRRPRGRANPTSLTSLSLIDQAYEYSSDIFTDYLERRSLFKDSQWFLSQPSCSQGSVKNLKKWAGDFGSSIHFPSTDLLITRQQKGQGQGQAGLEKQLRLSPYQCRSTAEQDHNEGGDHCESDENGIGSSRKPMPKKKRGKKARQDQSNEAYQVIMQIYKRNQWYLHAGGTVNTVQFSSSYSMNRQDNTCTHYLAVGTSCINWYGEMNEASAAAGLGVGYDHPHEVADSGSPFSQTPNLLQIYSVIISLNDPIDQDPDSDPDPAVGVAADAVSPTILSVKLAYCVGFQACGPIWDVKWCPEDNFRSLEAEDSVLGTVAIVSADGKCRVLVLPTPQSLRVSADADTVPPNIAIPEAIRDVPIISETDLCRWELSSVSECVLSVAWGGGNGGKGQDGVSPLLLACGLSTGSIALWDLSLPTLQHSVAAAKHSSSNGAGSSPHDPKLVVSYLPLSKFVDMTVRVGNTATSNARAVACGVRVISFCPYDGDLLASGGYDGTLKVFSLLSTLLIADIHRYGISGIASVQSTLVTNQLRGSMLWNGIVTAAESCGLPQAIPRSPSSLSFFFLVMTWRRCSMTSFGFMNNNKLPAS